MRGIHWSPVNSPHKGQWRGALMFSLICPWINAWINNREAGDLRCHPAHYDITVMWYISLSSDTGQVKGSANGASFIWLIRNQFWKNSIVNVRWVNILGNVKDWCLNPKYIVCNPLNCNTSLLRLLFTRAQPASAYFILLVGYVNGAWEDAHAMALFTHVRWLLIESNQKSVHVC